MRIALISNPFASSVTRRAKIVIQKALSADHELTVSETARKGQAIRLAHGEARSGAEVVIALGGDGTINEVANGVLGEACAIAPLPGGSTNVFARSIGYPNDAIEATGTLLEALAAGSIETASAGLANGRAFLFHAGAGFDAAVVAKVEGRGPLKRYLGHPLFIASAFSTWFRDVDRRQAWFSIEDDRRTPDRRCSGRDRPQHLSVHLSGQQAARFRPRGILADPAVGRGVAIAFAPAGPGVVACEQQTGWCPRPGGNTPLAKRRGRHDLQPPSVSLSARW